MLVWSNVEDTLLGFDDEEMEAIRFISAELHQNAVHCKPSYRDIHKAFKAAAKLLHPDKNDSAPAQNQMKTLNGMRDFLKARASWRMDLNAAYQARQQAAQQNASTSSSSTCPGSNVPQIQRVGSNVTSAAPAQQNAAAQGFSWSVPGEGFTEPPAASGPTLQRADAKPQARILVCEWCQKDIEITPSSNKFSSGKQVWLGGTYVGAWAIQCRQCPNHMFCCSNECAGKMRDDSKNGWTKSSASKIWRCRTHSQY
jgi:hypothetical protein